MNQAPTKNQGSAGRLIIRKLEELVKIINMRREIMKNGGAL